MPVSFRDALNLPIQNISIVDLEAKTHSKPVKVLSIQPDNRPHRIVLALDISASMGSMAGEPSLWKLEFSLARHFFEMNNQRAQLALFLFNERVSDVIGFSQGNAAVGAALRKADADPEYVRSLIKGKTALLDAIIQGIQLIDHPTSADAVYVLTDGGDNVSHQGDRDLSQRLAVTSVRLFAILLWKPSPYRSRTPEEINGPNALAEIAQKSGGDILTAAEWHGGHVSLSADREAKLKAEETLNRLYQTILQDHLLEIELPLLISKEERWELKLSETARHRWKGAQIIYPVTLLSCNAEVSSLGRN